MSTYGPGQPQDVVTGEAVALDLRLAQLPTRALALMIDMVLQVGTLIALILVVGALGGSLDGTATAALLLVVMVSVIVGYPLVLETLTRGRTVGKLAFGLRVVRDDGGAIRFRQALARALVEVVEIWLLFGVPALFCSLLNPKGKRIGDLAAGTVVVRERVPAEAGARAEMPPELAGWAAATDMGRVPDDLALAIRQFLARAPGLDGQVRWNMGQRLTADVLPWLVPKPPPGSTNERLLSAVIAERRRRDQHRMAGEAAAARGWVQTPGTPSASTTSATMTSPDPYAVPIDPAAGSSGPSGSWSSDGGFQAPS